MANSLTESSTKQKILTYSADLFAVKGFTETTVRELAAVVGLKASSIYSHFPSKNAILEYMLNDYLVHNTEILSSRDISLILKENPTTDGILNCMQLVFPEDTAAYYLKVLCVLLQEQHRNLTVRDHVTKHIILHAEQDSLTIINTLKELGIIRPDTDPDYWIKTISNLFYTFSSRMTLGIGDNSPGFTGMGMVEMLRYTYDLLLEKFGVKEAL